MRIALWTTNSTPPKNEVDDTLKIEVEDDSMLDHTNALSSSIMRRFVEDVSKD